MTKKAAPKGKTAKKASKPENLEGSVSYRPFEALAKKAKADQKAKQAASARPDTTDKASKTGATASARKDSPAPSQGPRRTQPSVAAAPGSAVSGSPLANLPERESFAMYMAGVRSLGDGALRIPASAQTVERTPRSTTPAPDLDAPARDRLRALVTEGVRFELSDDGGQLEGRRIDMDPRDLRRLRRGSFAIDGRLDLHGKSASDARASLEAFIKKKATDGDRVVLIIHGKGAHSAGGVGVLRGEIGAWLSQGLASRHVGAFTTAPPEDGGEGALLVLLAR